MGPRDLSGPVGLLSPTLFLSLSLPTTAPNLQFGVCSPGFEVGGGGFGAGDWTSLENRGIEGRRGLWYPSGLIVGSVDLGG